MTKKFSSGEASVTSVSTRLATLIALFSDWAENGVPKGISFPSSRTAARTWTCPEYGILTGIGSRRDVSSSHPTYGKSVKILDKLIAKLRPMMEQQKEPRKNETAKAKARRFELSAQQFKARFEGVSKQYSEVDEALSRALRDLASEQERSRSLERRLDQVTDENARLKRELAASFPGLRVVE